MVAEIVCNALAFASFVAKLEDEEGEEEGVEEGGVEEREDGTQKEFINTYPFSQAWQDFADLQEVQ